MVHSKSETQTSTRIPGIFRPLLSLPVFYKVLFANSLIIFVGATGGTWLTSLLISLAILEESITTQEARDRIADTRKLAHQTLRAIRNLSIDLRPSALDDLGLLPALRWYVKEYQQKCSIVVEFAAHGFKE